MSRLYIHFPFCKQACYYCNFHFSTSMHQRNEMLKQLLNELELQQHFLPDRQLKSIYFGGGTPSLLQTHELEAIFNQIRRFYTVAQDAEITLEANPDDITRERLLQFLRLGINRLSMGVQSFFDEDLVYMNRSHHAAQAKRSLQQVKEAGFESFSVDLIFGYPLLSHDKWKQNLEILLGYSPPHISAYSLTVEPQTAWSVFVKKGTYAPVDNEQAAGHFEYLMETLEGAGYEQYEISNYSIPGKRARHNSSYWHQEAYLGIGPSAHSYNGVKRQWNISNNALYIKSLQMNHIPFEEEILTREQKLNEYMMVSLRTSEGLSISSVQSQMKAEEFTDWFSQTALWIQQGMLLHEDHYLRLTRKGKLMADGIAADLFV